MNYRNFFQFHSDWWKFLEMNSKIEKIGFFVKIFSGKEKLYCVGYICSYK